MGRVRASLHSGGGGGGRQVKLNPYKGKKGKKGKGGGGGVGKVEAY